MVMIKTTPGDVLAGTETESKPDPPHQRHWPYKPCNWCVWERTPQSASRQSTCQHWPPCRRFPLNCCRESDANRTRPLMLRLVKEQANRLFYAGLRGAPAVCRHQASARSPTGCSGSSELISTRAMFGMSGPETLTTRRGGWRVLLDDLFSHRSSLSRTQRLTTELQPSN